MNRPIMAACAALFVLGSAGLALADGVEAPRQIAQADHGQHAMPGHAPAADDPAARAFMEANERMHRDMAIDYTGDADVDFVRGMIPHHQGAIDMARVVLEHGTDPDIRALAEEIIAAQEAEIEMMQEWLAARGHN